jgi:hypothetical protein
MAKANVGIEARIMGFFQMLSHSCLHPRENTDKYGLGRNFSKLQ